ncbi:MAG: glycosyltransferase family 2 protein [Flavobacteriales bacterium]|nr:glycosyltransferase family 2 protein [Flavobacteriales bacterium]
MKVSVVMPVYNKADFLREAVESILHGTYKDLELICVDDMSADGSVAVLRSINDPRLRILELPENVGPGRAANAGMDAAIGEYIVRMDADDIAVPERIALQTAFMDAHPEVGASGGQLQLFGTEDQPWTFPLDADRCAAELLFGVPVAQPASILRRSVLLAQQLHFDPAWPRIGEDWLFWLRMAPHTRFANLPEVLVRYRRGPQNIGHGSDKVANFTWLQRQAFQDLGIPFTEEELDLHLMGSTIFKVKPTVARVRALRRWYDRLLALNAEQGFAPRKAFAERVEQQWNKLFHYLPRYGLSVALAHLRLNSGRTVAQLTYALKYRVNALRGKLPNG